ncbi:hypothetical protein H5410_015941 [Solanum commersonii]|uniref:Uncharacterized protein n=1 Tax=Solanum commersonii TaxID=4109 RepID=A0A9J5ZUW3_SOLCO|nr:hypothetical protein H5410_015941 [Solanum commersonii]
MLEDPNIVYLISDSILHFTKAVADSLNLPRRVLRTGGVSSCLAYAAIPLLQNKAYFPIQAIEINEFLEIAWCLANINYPFLWVVRPGLIRGSEWIEWLPSEFLEIVNGRGHIAKWAPQQQVLAHPAVGAFWTHNGWNSTLESICEGIPMMCMPCFGDQMVNARYVSHVWKVGVQLENDLKRINIENAIRRLMEEEEGKQIKERMLELKEKANSCLMPGGSSYESLRSLTSYISSF